MEVNSMSMPYHDALAVHYPRPGLKPDDFVLIDALYERLAARFGYRPELAYSATAGSSKAHISDIKNSDGKIVISLKTWRGAKEALLHEFAHIVQYKSGGSGHGRD